GRGAVDRARQIESVATTEDHERSRRGAPGEVAVVVEEGEAPRVLVERDHDADTERRRVAVERLGVERFQRTAEERAAVELFGQSRDRTGPAISPIEQRAGGRRMGER